MCAWLKLVVLYPLFDEFRPQTPLRVSRQNQTSKIWQCILFSRFKCSADVRRFKQMYADVYRCARVYADVLPLIFVVDGKCNWLKITVYVVLRPSRKIAMTINRGTVIFHGRWRSGPRPSEKSRQWRRCAQKTPSGNLRYEKHKVARGRNRLQMVDFAHLC